MQKRKHFLYNIVNKIQNDQVTVTNGRYRFKSVVMREAGRPNEEEKGKWIEKSYGSGEALRIRKWTGFEVETVECVL